jgi:hypothetical protein
MLFARPVESPSGTMKNTGSSEYAMPYAANGNVPKAPTRKQTTSQ